MKISYLIFCFLICISAHGTDQKFNYYNFYEVNHKDRTLGIDACDLDPYADGERKKSNPRKKPEKLYLITGKGPVELNYVNIKRVQYKVCDSVAPRNLWTWKSSEEIKGVPLIVDNPNLRLEEFAGDFKKVDLLEKDWEKLSSLNGRKQWSARGNKDCNVYSSNDFLRLECAYTAYLFHNYKLIVEHGDPDNYSVKLNYIGQVKYLTESYYFAAFNTDHVESAQSNREIILKSKSGKEIHPIFCPLPTKC